MEHEIGCLFAGVLYFSLPRGERIRYGVFLWDSPFSAYYLPGSVMAGASHIAKCVASDSNWTAGIEPAVNSLRVTTVSVVKRTVVSKTRM